MENRAETLTGLVNRLVIRVEQLETSIAGLRMEILQHNKNIHVNSATLALLHAMLDIVEQYAEEHGNPLRTLLDQAERLLRT